MTMITIDDDQLVVRFPEVHEHAACRISFQRTLRIPDDGKDYALPAGLGDFPLRHLDDFAPKLSAVMLRRGGVVMPMWQAEAMWIHFRSRSWEYGDGYPFAVKIATGKINAVTGKTWSDGLQCDPQDYVVLPRQPWLDGYCVEKGVIRQFVAMPLGDGYTVEEQLVGAADHGGIQIAVYPMRTEVYERQHRREIYSLQVNACAMDMGLALGGRMKQEIYKDSYGFDVWDRSHCSRCFVTILNALEWQAITGELQPKLPISAKEYKEHGIPWFDYYAADQTPLGGAPQFQKVRSVSELAKENGAILPGSNDPVQIEDVRELGVRRGVREPNQVREGRL